MGDKKKQNYSIELVKTQVSAGVTALRTYMAKVHAESLVDESHPIHLQITMKKVPKVKNKIIKVSLPHSLVQPTSDVCLFVRDLNRKDSDYSPTERHFQALLASKGVKSVTKVLPLKALKLEYKPFEAKRNLSDMYDVYLADANIMRLLPPFLGKNFYSKKRYPVQVNLDAKNLQQEISKALTTAQCVISGRGSSCQVTVAHTELSASQTQDNVSAAVECISSSLPGGPANIRNIHIKHEDSPAIPIYVSMENSDDVELKEKKRKRKFQAAPEDVSTVLGSKVRVTQDGHIRLIPDGEEENAIERRKKFLASKGKARIKKAKKVGLMKKMVTKRRAKLEAAGKQKSAQVKSKGLKNTVKAETELNDSKKNSLKSEKGQLIANVSKVKKGKNGLKQPASKKTTSKKTTSKKSRAQSKTAVKS